MDFAGCKVDRKSSRVTCYFLRSSLGKQETKLSNSINN
jgi:hypothetical protein